MKIRLTILICLLGFALKGFSEEEPKFKVTPSGRVLIDGAFYFGGNEDMFKNGMAIPEARLGAKMSYGKWSSWIDVGFAYGKIGLRNMWVQYDFNQNNSIRIGNYLQPFGIQGVSTTSVKSTFEQPLVSALFTPGLQLGGMYTFQNPHVYSSTSFHVESSALTNIMNFPEFNKQGFTLLSRVAWRKNKSETTEHSILQAGLSAAASSPQRRLEDGFDYHDGFANSANFPSKVSNREALGFTIGNAKALFKFSPEFLFSKGRLAMQAQYFLQVITRKDNLPDFISHGGYVTLRGLILGNTAYAYDPVGAQLSNPKKKTLECVVDYNYASLSDKKAHVWGGRANSFNLTFNYYFNPYITARLNYCYTHVWDRKDFQPATQNVVQARIMVLF